MMAKSPGTDGKIKISVRHRSLNYTAKGAIAAFAGVCSAR
jgi:hypothetical protein